VKIYAAAAEQLTKKEGQNRMKLQFGPIKSGAFQSLTPN
jgi:hypothetical protein